MLDLVVRGSSIRVRDRDRGGEEEEEGQLEEGKGEKEGEGPELILSWISSSALKPPTQIDSLTTEPRLLDSSNI